MEGAYSKGDGAHRRSDDQKKKGAEPDTVVQKDR